jgi:WD40 repeat protein/tRNA A-37 threonylcarbamoyl transferase component Bud32
MKSDDRQGMASQDSGCETAPYQPNRAAEADISASTVAHIGEASTQAWSASKAAPPAAPPRMVIGDYEILGEIARGGMGVVYKARHHALGRVVALKQIRSGELANQDDLLRFQAEGQAAAQLDHPGIVPVYTVGEEGSHPYLAMAFIDGPSLWQQVKEQPLAQRQAARLMQQVAQAVDYAHQRGIVHRDLKPHNILLAPGGQPKITDFGLAKRAEDSNLTQTGQILGTPSYMPPEQAAGQAAQVGPLSDVYSLGATLYCLITGRPPFQSSSPLETLKQVLEQEPVSPRELNRSISKDLETICLKCLQKSPQRRYASAGELAADLQRFIDGEAILARPITRLERAWRWARRKPLAAGLGAMTVVALVLLTWGLWHRGALIATAQQLQAAERLKSVSEFHKTMSQIREASASAVHGWTWEAETQLRKARQSMPSEEEVTPWQTTYAELLTRHDLRHLRTIGEGIKTSEIAFSPDGKRVALGMNKHATEYSVSVYRVSDGAPLDTYTASSVAASLQQLLSGNAKYQDGIRALTWSPDGRWLVAGTRFGSLVRWDTQAAKQPGILWKGHNEWVERAEFTADGAALVTAADEWKIWNTSDWTQQHVAQDAVDDFSLSPDGKQLALMMRRVDRVDLIELQSRNTTAHLAGSARPAHSPDGRFLATTLNDGSRWVAIRQAETGAMVRTWRAERGGATLQLVKLAYLADNVLLGLDVQGSAYFWNSATGEELLPMLDVVSSGSIVGIHPASRTLAIASTTALRATDLYELRLPAAVRWLSQPGLLRGFDCSPDGTYWSIASDLDLRTMGRNHRWLQRLEWSVEQRQPIDSQRVSYHRAWNPTASAVVARHPQQDRVAWFTEWLGLMVSPIGSDGASDRFVRYPLAAAPVEIDVAGFADSPQAQAAQLSESADGKSASLDGSTLPAQLALPFSRLPLDAAQHGLVVATQQQVTGPAAGALETGWFDESDNDRQSAPAWLFPRGSGHWQTLAALDADSIKARPAANVVIGISAGEPPAPGLLLNRAAAFPYGKSPDSTEPASPDFGPVAWSPDGRRLWGLFDSREQLAAWDAKSLDVGATWNARPDIIAWGSANIHGLAAGNRYVITASDSGLVRVFSAEATGELAPLHELHRKGVEWLATAMSADESWVVLTTPSGKVELRSLPTLELVNTIAGHQLPVRTVALARQDRLLATGCDDGWLRLFHIDGAGKTRPWIKLQASGPIHSIRLSANGRRLAAASPNATSLAVWDLGAIEERLRAERIDDRPPSPSALTGAP